MPRQSPVQLSVIVVTHNSADAGTASLPAICAQLRDDDELVVADNASIDGTLAAVAEHAPAAVVLETGANLGFAAAANAGARAARGALLVFLNPDATAAPGFVDAIRAPRRDWTAWQGLVTADHGRAVNTSGGVVHFTGIAWAGQAAAAGPRDVAFLSGACLAIPRAERSEERRVGKECRSRWSPH